jgi:hypothetical protein
VPVPFYRLHLGSLFGHRLLLLVHRGRHSGRIFRTPLEVVRYDAVRREATVIAPWHAEWLKNIELSPALEVWIGSTHFRPLQRFLTAQQIAEVLDAYRQRGRLEALGIARFLGWRADLSSTDRERIAARLYGVAFSPRAETRT